MDVKYFKRLHLILRYLRQFSFRDEMTALLNKTDLFLIYLACKYFLNMFA